MSALPNPASVDDLTPDWLTAVLRQAGWDAVAVESVDHEALTYGRMTSVFRLTVHYEEAVGAPDTLIIKIPGQSEHARLVGAALRIYEREARFYRELAPHLDVRVPRCYYEGSATGGRAPSLLLEDLGESVGNDQVLGASLDQAERAMDWMAGLHAAYWDVVDRRPECAWVPTLGEFLSRVAPLLDEALVDARAIFGGPATDQAIDAIAASLPSLADVSGLEPPSTLLLTDARMDNMIFRPSGDVVGFDWQGVAIGPGIYDVATFLVGSLNTSDRRKHERALLRRWADGLRAAGADPGPDDRLFDRYHQATMKVAYASILTCRGLDICDSDAFNASARLTQRMYAAVDDIVAVRANSGAA